MTFVSGNKLDVNHSTLKKNYIYSEGQLTGLENWTKKNDGEFQGKKYTIFQKTIHHNSFSWKFLRGAAATIAIVLTLGFAYRYSNSIKRLWREGNTGNEIKLIKVSIMDDHSISSGTANSVKHVTNLALGNYIAFGTAVPKDSNLSCFAEDHTDETFHRKAIPALIDQLYQEGDIILIEGVKSGQKPKTESIYHEIKKFEYSRMGTREL